MNEQHSANAREELLQAWIDMSLMIRGNRLVSGFSFNEMIICRILYERRMENGTAVTATELCQRMQLLKSQINKLLTGMEKVGAIERIRSQNDRRKIEIRLTEEALAAYEQSHERILRIIGYVYDYMGASQADQLTILLKEAVTAIHQLPSID